MAAAVRWRVHTSHVDFSDKAAASATRIASPTPTHLINAFQVRLFFAKLYLAEIIILDCSFFGCERTSWLLYLRISSRWLIPIRINYSQLTVDRVDCSFGLLVSRGHSRLGGFFFTQVHHLFSTTCSSKQAMNRANFFTLKIWTQSDHWIKSYGQKS